MSCYGARQLACGALSSASPVVRAIVPAWEAKRIHGRLFMTGTDASVRPLTLADGPSG